MILVNYCISYTFELINDSKLIIVFVTSRLTLEHGDNLNSLLKTFDATHIVE